jgi:hypothetical protein
MSRVFGYISTEDCDFYDNPPSLDYQIKRINKYCKENDLSIQKIFQDVQEEIDEDIDENIDENIDEGEEDISFFEELFLRPNLQEMLSDVRKGDIYLISSMSRLCESPGKLAEIYWKIYHNNCKLIFVDIDEILSKTTLFDDFVDNYFLEVIKCPIIEKPHYTFNDQTLFLIRNKLEKCELSPDTLQDFNTYINQHYLNRSTCFFEHKTPERMKEALEDLKNKYLTCDGFTLDDRATLKNIIKNGTIKLKMIEQQ